LTLGAITRWQLSRFNPTIPSFPLGTFLANILATLLYAITIIIQARPGVSIPLLPCAVLYGLDEGFCGCLSTISTFAVELDTLIRRHAYFYASVSITVGILGMVLVVGIPAWTRGFESVCGL
jgi:fluoride ion exporter CrcB/FEX